MRGLIDVINTDSKFLGEVIRPFYSILGLNFFNHLRVYKNSKVVGVISNPDWVDNYFSNGLHQYDFSSMPFEMMQSGHHVLDLNTAPRCMEPIFRAAYEFDMSRAFSIVDKQADYCDHYLFAGPNVREDLTEYFLSHIDLFRQFIFYYKEQVFLDQKVGKYLKRELSLGCKNDVTVKADIKEAQCDLSARLENAIKVKKIHIKGNLGEVWLTTRELDCLSSFLYGNTTKVTAACLNISPRTVETHIRNIQLKMGVHNTLQLFRLITDDKLLFQYMVKHYEKKCAAHAKKEIHAN
jgi:DNA-binding CsgD family transcriptional regulator